MASEADTPEPLVMQTRDEDLDRTSRQLTIGKDHLTEHTNFEDVLQINIEGREPDDEERKTILQDKNEDTDGESFFCPPSVEKVSYKDLVRNSDDFPEVSDDAKNTNQYIDEELSDIENDNKGNPEITKARIEHSKNINLLEKVEDIPVCVHDEQPEGMEIKLETQQKITAQTQDKETQKYEDEKMTPSDVEHINILQTSSLSIDRKESMPETMMNVQEFGVRPKKTINAINEKKSFGVVEKEQYKERASSLSLEEGFENTTGTSEERNFESKIHSQGQDEENINSVATLLSETETCLTIKHPVETVIHGGSAEEINTEPDSMQVQEKEKKHDQVGTKENYQLKALNNCEIIVTQSSDNKDSNDGKQEPEIIENEVQRKDECTQKAHKDIQVNEVEGEAAIEEHQCHRESENPKEDNNGVCLHEIRETNNVQENQNSENTIGLNQGIYVESDNMDVLQDVKNKEQIGYNEIVPGKENYANVTDEVDQDIKGHSRSIKIQMNENSTEETGYTDIPEIGAVINKKIVNQSFEDSEFCSRKQDQEIARESSVLTGAKITSEETQISEVEKAVIQEQLQSLEKNDPNKIEPDVPLHEVKGVESDQRTENSVKKMEKIDEDMYADSEAQTEEYCRTKENQEVAEKSPILKEATTSSEETQNSEAETAEIEEQTQGSETKYSNKIEYSVPSNEVELEIEQRTENYENKLEIFAEDMYAASNSSEAQKAESCSRKEGHETAEDSSTLTDVKTSSEETQINEGEKEAVIQELLQSAETNYQKAIEHAVTFQEVNKLKIKQSTENYGNKMKKDMYVALNNIGTQTEEACNRKEHQEIVEVSPVLKEAKTASGETQISEAEKEAAIEEQLQNLETNEQNEIENGVPPLDVEMEIEQRTENSKNKMENVDEDMQAASNTCGVKIVESSFTKEGQGIAEESSMLREAITISEETQINEDEKDTVIEKLHCSKTNHQNNIEDDVPLQETARLEIEQRTKNYPNKIEEVDEDVYVEPNIETQTEDSCFRKEDQQIVEESTILKETKTSSEETRINEAEEKAVIEEELQNLEINDQNKMEHDIPPQEVGLDIEQTEKSENKKLNVDEDMHAASNNCGVPIVESSFTKEGQGIAEESSMLAEAKTISEDTQINESEKDTVIEKLQCSKTNHQNNIEDDVPLQETTRFEIEQSTENYPNKMEEVDEDMFIEPNIETQTEDSCFRKEDQQIVEESTILSETKTSSEETRINEAEEKAVIEEQPQNLEINDQNEIEHDIPPQEVGLDIEQTEKSKNKKLNVDEDMHAASNCGVPIAESRFTKEGQGIAEESSMLAEAKTISKDTQINESEKDTVIEKLQCSKTNHQNNIEDDVPLQETTRLEIEQSTENYPNKMEEVDKDVYVEPNNIETQTEDSCFRKEDQQIVEESTILKETKTSSEETRINGAEEKGVIEEQQQNLEINDQNEIEHDVPPQEVGLDIEQTEKSENKMVNADENWESRDMDAASNSTGVQIVESSLTKGQVIEEESSTLTEVRNLKETQINEVENDTVLEELHCSKPNYQRNIEDVVQLHEITKLEIEQSNENYPNKIEEVNKDVYVEPNNIGEHQEIAEETVFKDAKTSSEETQFSEAEEEAVIELQLQNLETNDQTDIEHDVPPQEFGWEIEQRTENSKNIMENIDEDMYPASKSSGVHIVEYSFTKEGQDIAEESSTLMEVRTINAENQINDLEIDTLIKELHCSQTNYQNNIEDDVPLQEITRLDIEQSTKNYPNKMKEVDEDVYVELNNIEIQHEDSCFRKEDQKVAEESTVLKDAKTSSEETGINQAEEKVVIEEQLQILETNDQNEIEHDVQRTEDSKNKMENVDEDMYVASNNNEVQTVESWSIKESQEIGEDSSTLIEVNTSSEESQVNEVAKEAVIQELQSSETNYQNATMNDVPLQETARLEIEQSTEDYGNKMEKVDKDMYVASNNDETQTQESCSRKEDQEIAEEYKVLTEAKTSSEETQISEVEKEVVIEELQNFETNDQNKIEHEIPSLEAGLDIEQRTENSENKMGNNDEELYAASNSSEVQTLEYCRRKGQEIAEDSSTLIKAKTSSQEETQTNEIEKEAVIQEQLHSLETNHQNTIKQDVPLQDVIKLEIEQSTENCDNKIEKDDEESQHIYAASNNTEKQSSTEDQQISEEASILKEAKTSCEETQIIEADRQAVIDELQSLERNDQNKIEHYVPSQEIRLEIEQKTASSDNKMEKIVEDMYAASNSSGVQTVESCSRNKRQDVTKDSSTLTEAKNSTEESQIKKVGEVVFQEQLHNSEINNKKTIEDDVPLQDITRLEIELSTEKFVNKMEKVDEEGYAASNNSEPQTEESSSRLDHDKGEGEEAQISEIEEDAAIEEQLQSSEIIYQNKIEDDVASRELVFESEQETQNSKNIMENVDQDMHAASNNSEVQTVESYSRKEGQEIAHSSTLTKHQTSSEETLINEVEKEAVIYEKLHSSKTNYQKELDVPPQDVKRLESLNSVEHSENKMENVDEDVFAKSNNREPQAEEYCSRKEDQGIANESPVFGETKTSSEESQINEAEKEVVIEKQLQKTEKNYHIIEHDVHSHEVGLEIDQRTENFENKMEIINEESCGTEECQEVAEGSSKLKETKTSSEEVQINEEKEKIKEQLNSSETNHQNTIEHDVPLQEVKGLEIVQSTKNSGNKIENVDEDVYAASKGSETQLEESCSRKYQEITEESLILKNAKTLKEETIIIEAEQETMTEALHSSEANDQNKVEQDVASHEVELELEQRTANSGNEMENIDEDIDDASNSNETQKLTKGKTTSEETQISKVEKDAVIEEQLHSSETNYQNNIGHDVASHEVEFQTEQRTGTMSKMEIIDEDKDTASNSNQAQKEVSYSITMDEEIAEESSTLTEAKVTSEETQISEVEKEAVIEELHSSETNDQIEVNRDLPSYEIGQRTENDQYKIENEQEDVYAASNNSEPVTEESCTRKEDQEFVECSALAEAKTSSEETQISEIEEVTDDQLHSSETNDQNKIEHDIISHDIGLEVEHRTENKIEYVDEDLYAASNSSKAQTEESSAFTETKTSSEETQISEVTKETVIEEQLHSSVTNDESATEHENASHEVKEIKQRAENFWNKMENADEDFYATSNNSGEHTEESCSRKDQEIYEESSTLTEVTTSRETNLVSGVEIEAVIQEQQHNSETNDRNYIEHNVPLHEVKELEIEQRIVNSESKMEYVGEDMYAESNNSEAQIDESINESEIHENEDENHKKLVNQIPEEHYSCSEKQDQDIPRKDDSNRISNEYFETSQVETEDCLETKEPIKTQNWTPLNKVVKDDNVPDNTNLMNVVEDMDQEESSQPESIEIQKDKSEHIYASCNEIHELGAANKKIVKQSSEERHYGVKEIDDAKACMSLKENEYDNSGHTENCGMVSSKECEVSKDSNVKEQNVTKQYQSSSETNNPNNRTIDVPIHEVIRVEIIPENKDPLNIVQNVNQDKKEKANINDVSKEINDTKVDSNDEIENRSSTKTAFSGGKQAQESTEASTTLPEVLPEVENVISSNYEFSKTSYDKGEDGDFEENAMTGQQQSHEEPEGKNTTEGNVPSYDVREPKTEQENEDFTNIVDVVNQEKIVDLDSIVTEKVEATDEQIGSNDRETRVQTSEDIVNQSLKKSGSHSDKQEQQNILTTTRAQSPIESKDDSTISSEGTTVFQCKEESALDTADPGVSLYEGKGMEIAPQKEQFKGTVDVKQDMYDPSDNFNKQKDEETNDKNGFNKNNGAQVVNNLGIVQQSSKENISCTGKRDIREECRPQIEIQKPVAGTDERANASDKGITVIEVKQEADPDNEQFMSANEDPNVIKNHISSYEVRWSQITQENEGSLNTVEKFDQDIKEKSKSIEEQQEEKTNEQTITIENHEAETANKEDIVEASPITTEAENSVPSKDERTRVAAFFEGQQCNLESKSQSRMENKTSSYEVKSSEIEQQTEISSNKIEVNQEIKVQSHSIGGQKDDEAQEEEIYELKAVNDDETVNQSSKDSDSSHGKHNQQVSGTSTTTTKAEVSIPSTNECTRNSGDIYQVREVEDIEIEKLQCSIDANYNQNRMENVVQFYEGRGVEIEQNDHGMSTVEDLTQGTNVESNNIEAQKDETKEDSYENQPQKVDGDEMGKLTVLELYAKKLVTHQDFLDAKHEVNSSETTICHIKCEDTSKITAENALQKEIRQANEPHDQLQEPSSEHFEQKEVITRNNDDKDESSREVDILKEEEPDIIPGVDMQLAQAEKSIATELLIAAPILQGANSFSQIKTNKETDIYNDSSLDTNSFAHSLEHHEKDCKNPDSDTEKDHDEEAHELKMDEHQGKDNLKECKVEAYDITRTEVNREANISHDSRIFEREATRQIFQQAPTESKTDSTDEDMNSMDNTSERPSEKNVHIQDNYPVQKHELNNFNEMNILNLKVAHVEGKGDKEETLDVRTTVEIPQIDDVEMYPPKLEEILFAKDAEGKTGIAELHQDSRNVISRVDASQSTESIELNDAKREPKIPDVKELQMNFRDVNEIDSLASHISQTNETDEQLNTPSCTHLPEILITTKPFTEMEYKALEETSSQKSMQEACLETIIQGELEVPNLNDKPTGNSLPKELAEDVQTTGNSSTTTVLMAEENKLANFEAHENARDKVKYEDKEKQSLDELGKLVTREEEMTNCEDVEGDAKVNGQEQTENEDSKETLQTEKMRDLDNSPIQGIVGAKEQDWCGNVTKEENMEEVADTRVGPGEQLDHSVESEQKDSSVASLETKEVADTRVGTGEQLGHSVESEQKDSSVASLETKEVADTRVGTGEQIDHSVKSEQKDNSVASLETKEVADTGEQSDHNVESEQKDISVEEQSDHNVESEQKDKLVEAKEVADTGEQSVESEEKEKSSNAKEGTSEMDGTNAIKGEGKQSRDINEEVKKTGKTKDKKSHNILTGVISKVKKAITCSSSQFATQDDIIKVKKT